MYKIAILYLKKKVQEQRNCAKCFQQITRYRHDQDVSERMKMWKEYNFNLYDEMVSYENTTPLKSDNQQFSVPLIAVQSKCINQKMLKCFTSYW